MGVNADIAGLRMTSEGIIPRRVWNRLLDLIVQNTVVEFRGGIVQRRPFIGTVISTETQTASTTSFPWKVYASKTESAAFAHINGGDGFAPKLDGITAQIGDVDCTTLTAGVPPKVTVTGNGYLYGTITTDGTTGARTSIPQVSFGTAVPTDSSTEFHFIIADILDWNGTDKTYRISQGFTKEKNYRVCNGLGEVY